MAAVFAAAAGLTQLVLASTAQSIPPKGGAGTFEVASWNIEFFGGAGGPSDDDRQISNVRQTILASDIDVWALQEIADPDDFNSLLADLGPQFGGELAPTSSAQGLGLAFVYRKDTVRPRSIEEVLEQFSTGRDNPFAGRPPFQLTADVTLGDTTLVVTLINLHMKAQADQESYEKRAEASLRLKNHIDFTTLALQPVIVLGDLNDLLLGSITPGRISPYKNFVDDVGNYDTPTLQMQLDDRSTFCFSTSIVNGQPTCNGSTIDHIIVTNEVAPWYANDSADHYDELLSAFSSYISTTSDHLPVLAVFDVAQGVGVEDPPRSHASHEIRVTAYPNPWREQLTVDVVADRPGHTVLRLFDLVGRNVFTQSVHFPATGMQRRELELPTLPAGIYLLSSTGPLGQTSQLVVRR